MATNPESLASALNSLIATCKDGQEGFHSAAADVKNPALKSLFTDLSAERAVFAGELQQIVRGLGEGMEKSGSISGALHRGWIDLKSALTSGDEHAVLAECERGEDSAVDSYREALENSDLTESVRAVIQRQAMAVKAAHDRVRDLRDANQH